MKISEVTIEKFRSIKKGSFRMDNITAIVGENNAGKTSILRALNAVMNYQYEKESFELKRHQYAKKTNSYITLVFDEVPDRDVYKDRIQSGKIVLKFSYIYSENKRKISTIVGKSQLPADDTFLNEIKKDIMYVYIPAGRTNKDVKWNDDNNTVFKELLTAYMARHTEKRDAVSGYVRKATQKIHDTVLIKLEKEINELYMQNKNMDFRIDFPFDLDYSILLKYIELSLNEYDSNLLLQEWGSGTKSLAVIAMYRAIAQLRSGSIVLGIEEPENNLHPQAQKRFIMSLKNQLHDNETQTIFTTHSTVLVDELNHEDIVLVRRNSDETRGFISEITQLPTDFWSKYGIEEFKHYQFFNYRNSDFFFSKYVVVGESKNDCQVFEELVSNEISSKIADVGFLPVGGVESIKYPYYLLKELRIPFTLIVDKDYFFPYLVNNELDDSRNSRTGLPNYKKELKDDDVINDIFKTPSEREKLIKLQNKGYREFFSFIKDYGILSMNYCLEMDLTCSEKARNEYYTILNTKSENMNQKYLLEKNHKAIKKIDTIMKVIRNIPRGSYPESYLKINKFLIERINEYVK